MKRIVLLLIATLSLYVLHSQHQFSYEQISKSQPSLDSIITNYTLVEIDNSQLKESLSAKTSYTTVTLKFGSDYLLNLDLIPANIYSEDYINTSAESTAIVANSPYYIGASTSNNGGSLRLTITDNYISGYIHDQGNLLYIEPLSNFKADADPTLHIIYNTKDLINQNEKLCGFAQAFDESQKIKQKVRKEKNSSADCIGINYAVAADQSMVEKYGSAYDALIHINGTIFQAMGLIAHEFDYDLQLQIASNWFAKGADPWTASTNSQEVLANFRDWGVNGGFGTSHELAVLWTNRDFNGQTKGEAYRAGLCNDNGYHIIQDFTSSYLLTVLEAHEIGHNLNAVHDPDDIEFIMRPIIGDFSQWSTASQEAINEYLHQTMASGCLDDCSNPTPLVIPDYSINEKYICAGKTFLIFDESLYAESWEWTFPGATPSFSTDQFPIISYAESGTYSFTLKACNAYGCNEVLYNNAIRIEAKPQGHFTYTSSYNQVGFINQSTDATNYVWDFGDGMSSTEHAPNHEYEMGGIYIVNLTASSECGSSTVSDTIALTGNAPSASIELTDSVFCIGSSIAVSDQSISQPNEWNWSFPGAIQENYNVQNPSVAYQETGSYDIILIATNPLGSDTTILQNAITIIGPPSADGLIDLSEMNLSYQNNSLSADSIRWDFGDGNQSTAEQGEHIYTDEGSYDIQLIAMNRCGTDTLVESITIIGTSTGPLSTNQSITLFPNPVSTILYLNNSSAQDITDWRIYNINGALVSSRSTDSNSINNSIDIHQLPRGSYFLEVSVDSTWTYHRFIKQ